MSDAQRGLASCGSPGPSTRPTATASPLPSIGAPLRTGWGDGRKRIGTVRGGRQDKLGLWTAVALQNHFRQVGGAPVTADADAASGLQIERLPPAQPRQRRTLAQRMGLVPEPPPAPTEEDWQIAEARALRREQQGGLAQRLGNEVCGICLEPFYETLHQGQVILSCSHVFHENCFRQFERFTRIQQREDGANAAVLLACPECRQSHYHKRTFFAGKALAQRAAVVRIQAWVRRYLAEKRYTQMRLRHNPEFRDAYVQQRLAKLSHAWERYVEQQAAQQEAVLAALDSRREAAAAAYLTEHEWQQIIARRERAAVEQLLGGASPSDTLVLRPQSSAPPGLYPPAAVDVAFECAICLECIERSATAAQRDVAGIRSRPPQGSDATVAWEAADNGNTLAEPVPTSGEAYVHQLRQEYEQKREAEAHTAVSKKPTPKTPARTTHKKAESRAQRPAKRRSAPRVNASRPPASPVADPPLPNAASRPSLELHSEGEAARAGVILSCGHCFHGACLRVFEKYSEWRVLEEGLTYAPPRCPLCRAGYAKHPF